MSMTLAGDEDNLYKPEMENAQPVVGIVGGCGHVGLPLAISFAMAGMRTVIYDTNVEAVNKVLSGRMPFKENGAQHMLERALNRGMIGASTSPEVLSKCNYVVIVTGTPVDEHLNPEFEAVFNVIHYIRRFLEDGQTLILRSTVYPGTTDRIAAYIADQGLKVGVVFCPERVAQGSSLEEIASLPQIIATNNAKSRDGACRLFTMLGCKTVYLAPKEAELAKLMTNAYRYMQFAAVNHFYMIATANGLDFHKIQAAAKFEYPRLAGMPSPGLAAGPCLVKDTMQLAAFSQNQFGLGHAAMLVNEGMPAHMISIAEQQYRTPRGGAGIDGCTATILGMTFKANCDDIRDSLSFKLRKLLSMKVAEVHCHDVHCLDKKYSQSFCAQDCINKSSLVFIGVPHREYSALNFKGRVLIDPWNCVPEKNR